MERHETLELLMGRARFSGPKAVTVEMHSGNTRVLTAEHIFINVGTRPSLPPIPGLARAGALDNESVMELADVPEHLVVIGGGFVGLEFGQMFRRFGSRVTVLEAQSHCLPREDEDVAEQIATVIQVAMMAGLPYSALKDAVFPHPTLAESLNNLFMAMDTAK